MKRTLLLTLLLFSLSDIAAAGDFSGLVLGPLFEGSVTADTFGSSGISDSECWGQDLGRQELLCVLHESDETQEQSTWTMVVHRFDGTLLRRFHLSTDYMERDSQAGPDLKAANRYLKKRAWTDISFMDRFTYSLQDYQNGESFVTTKREGVARVADGTLSWEWQGVVKGTRALDAPEGALYGGWSFLVLGEHLWVLETWTIEARSWGILSPLVPPSLAPSDAPGDATPPQDAAPQ